MNSQIYNIYNKKIKINNVNFIVVVQAYCHDMLDAMIHVQQLAVLV